MNAILRIELSFPKGTKLRRGTCAVCGCKDKRACPEGCWWVGPTHHFCSACLGELLDGLQRSKAEVRNVTDEDHDGREVEFVALVLTLSKPRAPKRRKGASK